mgnify:CR=1 FL=1
MGKYWICICLAWGLGIGGCTPVQQYRYTEGKIYGTFYHISYASDEDLKEEILRQMESVNASLSMFNPESVIARLNRNETDSTDALFQKMYAMALQVNRKTEGAFDITVGPLVNAWGFGFKNGQDLTPAQIDSILSFVGFEKVALENGKIVKQDPRVILDCSAIAKGYGSDAVARLFDRKGIRNYMIEIGGEIVVKGLSPKEQKWKVGINKPIDDSLNVNNEIQTILNVTDLGIATSGNYRNFYYKDGKKYAHTIDPHTGYPVQHSILSSTVLAKDCATADAYATAFMVLGLEQAKKILQSTPDIQAYLIYADEKGKNQVYTTPALQTMMDR